MFPSESNVSAFLYPSSGVALPRMPQKEKVSPALRIKPFKLLQARVILVCLSGSFCEIFVEKEDKGSSVKVTTF